MHLPSGREKTMDWLFGAVVLGVVIWYIGSLRYVRAHCRELLHPMWLLPHAFLFGVLAAMIIAAWYGYQHPGCFVLP